MSREVRVDLFEAGADAGRQAELARFLREELLQLEVEDVRPVVGGPVPAGARGVEATAVASLIVAMGQAATGLRAVIGAVRSWLARGDAARSVRLEIDGDVLEISRVSRAHEARLVDVFIQRHSAGNG